MAHRFGGSSQVDIAILTVITPELFAARDALGIPEDARSKDEAGTISYRGKVRSALARRDYVLVLTCIGRAGNVLSATAVQDVIARYRPQAVLLVGIAAGVRGKVRIGEVVLSERVVSYEPAAVVPASDGGSRLEPRPEIRTLPHRMHQDVVHYQPSELRLQARFERQGGTFPLPPQGNEVLYQEHVVTRLTVKTATIASGEKLLRDPGKLLEVRTLHGKTEVGEMEAAGLMEACERSGIPWLAIRGISDFGDEIKDDHFHEFASRAAAAAMADFIEHGLELKGANSRWVKLPGWQVLAMGALLLAVGVGSVKGGHWWNKSSDGICGDDLGSGPFKRSDATHFLVARFQGDVPVAEPDFSDTVSTQVEHALKTYKEESLRNPQEVNIEVPEGSLEIARISCAIESHEQAESIAKALNADVVIWGQAFLEPGGKGYTVQPRATLYQLGRSIRRGGEGQMELSSLGRLDLPTLRSTEPFLLVQFALGLHFYDRENYWLAARFFEKSADLVMPKERGATEIQLALGMAYLHLPDLDRSLHYSRQALELVSGSGSSLESALINNIGSVLHAQGDYVGALKNYRRALAIDEKALGKDHPRVATFLNNIGGALDEQGDYAGALENYRRALAIDEKALGKDHPNVARDVNNIGGALKAQGDYAGALENYQRALAIDEKALGKDHPDVAACLDNIGGALHAQGDYAGALENHRRALAIAEKALGKDHPTVATCLNNIGLALDEQGDYAGALENYRRALAIAEKVLGKDHPTVATCLNNIGLALDEQGDYAGALENYRRALAIDEKGLGKDHPTVATDVNNIGLALRAQGDYAGALENYRRALAIDEKALGKDHPTVATDVNNIGGALHAQGDYAGALEHYRRALAIDEKALGKDHPDVATDLNNIGGALQAQGDYTGALKNYRRALAIAEKTLGKDHPKTRDVRSKVEALSSQ